MMQEWQLKTPFVRVLMLVGALAGGSGCGGGGASGTNLPPLLPPPTPLPLPAGYAVLHSFDFGWNGGAAHPFAGVILDSSRNVYGTTLSGTVFKVAVDGTYTVLHTFGAQDGKSIARLVLDGGGNLYGTSGGNSGGGVVFKLAPDGVYTVLHRFGQGGDGSSPSAGVTLDDAGNLYGTTTLGGGTGAGIVFKLALDGTYTVLHNLRVGGDPVGTPEVGVVLDRQRNLYGGGAGGVFKIAPDGTYTLLHTSSSVVRSVILDDAGNVYGAASHGESQSDYNGIVFEIAPDGTYTVLHTFNGNDGIWPWGDLARDGQGNIYGTTYKGGSSCAPVCSVFPDASGNDVSGAGVVFKVAADGTFRVLHNFVNGWPSGDGGRLPRSGAVLDSDGNLYGTTERGGLFIDPQFAIPADDGVVFRLAPDGRSP